MQHIHDAVLAAYTCAELLGVDGVDAYERRALGLLLAICDGDADSARRTLRCILTDLDALTRRTRDSDTRTRATELLTTARQHSDN